MHGELIVDHCLVSANESDDTGPFLRTPRTFAYRAGASSMTNPGYPGRSRIHCAPGAPLARRGKGNRPLIRSAAHRYAPTRPGNPRWLPQSIGGRSSHSQARSRPVTEMTSMPRTDTAGGERARLIQAQAIDAQYFDRREFLNKNAATSQRRRTTAKFMEVSNTSSCGTCRSRTQRRELEGSRQSPRVLSNAISPASRTSKSQ